MCVCIYIYIYTSGGRPDLPAHEPVHVQVLLGEAPAVCGWARPAQAGTSVGEGEPGRGKG